MATSSDKSLWSRVNEGIALVDWSLSILIVLMLWDVVLSGSYLVSVLVSPLWFLAAVVLAIVRRPGWGVAAARISMPFVAILLATANSSLQNSIARANSQRLIHACEQYQEDHGDYPEDLDDLVPDYLSSVPRAKYCLLCGHFMYWGPPLSMFWWAEIPPYGRRIYSLERAEWGYID